MPFYTSTLGRYFVPWPRDNELFFFSFPFPTSHLPPFNPCGPLAYPSKALISWAALNTLTLISSNFTFYTDACFSLRMSTPAAKRSPLPYPALVPCRLEMESRNYEEHAPLSLFPPLWDDFYCPFKPFNLRKIPSHALYVINPSVDPGVNPCQTV